MGIADRVLLECTLISKHWFWCETKGMGFGFAFVCEENVLFLMDELGKLLVLDIEMLLWGICALSHVQPIGFSVLVATD